MQKILLLIVIVLFLGVDCTEQEKQTILNEPEIIVTPEVTRPVAIYSFALHDLNHPFWMNQVVCCK